MKRDRASLDPIAVDGETLCRRLGPRQAHRGAALQCMSKVGRGSWDRPDAQHPSVDVPHNLLPMRSLGYAQLRFDGLTAVIDQFGEVITRDQMVQKDIADLTGKLDGVDDPLADLLGR